MDLDLDEIDRQVLSPGAMRKAKITPLTEAVIPQGRPIETFSNILLHLIFLFDKLQGTKMLLLYH